MRLLFRAFVGAFGDQVGRDVGREIARAGIEAFTADARQEAASRARRGSVALVALGCAVGLVVTAGVWLGHVEWAVAALFLVGLLAASIALVRPRLERRLAAWRRERSFRRTMAELERDCR
jgi:hypothetical protein